jgi:hypothetical protein
VLAGQPTAVNLKASLIPTDILHYG